jgi:nitrogen fixation protein
MIAMQIPREDLEEYYVKLTNQVWELEVTLANERANYITEVANLRIANAQLQAKIEELQEHIVRLCVPNLGKNEAGHNN